MEDILEDLFKIYLSCMESYNSKIYQTVNDKYTIIDKSMLTVYLFIKIIEDKNEKNQDVTDILSNYLLRQVIYSETGNIAFQISDESKFGLYHEILDKLILEKFEFKNRTLQRLKYNYKNIELNKYNELLIFLEDIAEFSIFQRMVLNGKKEAVSLLDTIKNKIIDKLSIIDNDDYFYKEKKEIISLIIDEKFIDSQYGNLMYIALNLKDVYRYSQIILAVPENVLFHQYTVTVISLIFAEYCNKELKGNIDIYTILVKSLFHDFPEYKGTEIIAHFKYYNEVTKKMFAEIEENDENELKEKIGDKFYIIISQAHDGAEGFMSDILDKMLGIMKLCVESEYFNNYTAIKGFVSVYQGRFKKFLKVQEIDGLKCKSFYLDLLRECYIYIKEHLMERNSEYFLKYFTKQELENGRAEIKFLRTNPEAFLRS